MMHVYTKTPVNISRAKLLKIFKCKNAAELCRRTGYCKSYVSQMLSGKRPLPEKIWSKIIEYNTKEANIKP